MSRNFNMIKMAYHVSYSTKIDPWPLKRNRFNHRLTDANWLRQCSNINQY